MRIVHVTSGLGRGAAGVRGVVLGLSRAQRALGLDVAVFGLAHRDWPEEKAEWQGVPVTAFDVIGPTSVGYAPGMRRALEMHGPDLVHLHGLWMHPGRSVLQWHARTAGKYIVSPHGMLAEAALSYSKVKKTIASFWYQHAVFAQASAFHATCTQEADEIRAYGLMRPVEIFANGILTVALPERHETPMKTVLSLGRVTRHKALDQLVEAWDTLEAAFPDWRLVIAGPDDNGERARLEALVAERELKRVIFHGAVYGEEKLRLMRDADIFALPTRSENFALTVAESLMLEVPVVASKGAPWSGLEREGCGRWVDFGAGPIALALREMMTIDDTARRDMGMRGRRWMARDFTWDSIAQQSLDAYRRIVGAL